MSFVIRLAGFAAFVLIALLIYVRYIQATAIFFPDKEIIATPADFGLAFEEVSLSTVDNQTIHGWFVPHDNAKVTLLFLHGNAGNISHRLEKISLLRQAGINIFIIDYRGYGKSTGSPSEKGLYSDAKAAYEYIRKECALDSFNIVLYGESIGASVAIDLAKDVLVRALIVEGAFSCGKDVGRIFYPFVPPQLLPNIFDSLSKITTIAVPKLFIHARDDEVIPFKLAQKLYASAPEPKQLVEISGGHNESYIVSKEQYTAAVIDFINNLSNSK